MSSKYINTPKQTQENEASDISTRGIEALTKTVHADLFNRIKDIKTLIERAEVHLKEDRYIDSTKTLIQININSAFDDNQISIINAIDSSETIN